MKPSLIVIILLLLSLLLPAFLAQSTHSQTDLVGYWKFDEGSGTMASDSSGLNNHATLINGPQWVDGVGKALRFDGVDDYVQASDSSSLDIGLSDYTVAAWVYVDSLPTESTCCGTIVSKTLLDYRTGYFVGIDKSVVQRIVFELSSPGGFVTGISMTQVTFNVWHHVAVTFSRSGVATFYLDGVPDGTVDISGFQGDLGNDQPLWIGNSETYTNLFSGLIDEVRIYSSALAASEVASLTSPAPIVPPLTADFSFSPASPVVGEFVTFTASTSLGTPPYSWAWDFGDSATGSGPNTSHAYSGAGTFSVLLTVQDAAGGTVTVSKGITISLPPPLAADFSFSPASPVVGWFVTFTASTSLGTPPYSWAWDFGDSATGSGQTTVHAYSSPGSFSVVLTVSDATGAIVTVSKSVQVSPVVVGGTIAGPDKLWPILSFLGLALVIVATVGVAAYLRHSRNRRES